MRTIKWLLFCVIVLFAVISWFHYQKSKDDTYKGMSIIPEQHQDIPLFKGLEATEHEYTMEGNRWVEIYDYYMQKLPEHGWRVEDTDSSLHDQDPENDWSGFRSRWGKEGFDGELWISAHYDQLKEQTVVKFDKARSQQATVWITKSPETISICQSQTGANSRELKEQSKIAEMARLINESIDWNEPMEPRNQSCVMQFGNMQIKVLFEDEKEIYLQSEKGAKLMKPEPDFLALLNL
ncbi:MAG: hypothetical protein ACM32O_12960 [Clostridia bacterium]